VFKNRSTKPGDVSAYRHTMAFLATRDLVAKTVRDALDGKVGCYRVQSPVLVSVAKDDSSRGDLLCWATFRMAVTCEAPVYSCPLGDAAGRLFVQKRPHG
jgi:hypothetical protein